MAARPKIPQWFQWVASPVICNGPMIGAACPALANAVSKARGVGFLPSTADLGVNSAHIAKLEADLVAARKAFGGSHSSGLLPVGVSFITGHESVSSFEATALPILKKHRPAAIWLFAPEEHVRPHARIIAAVRAALEPPTRIFVQVGNVTAARDAVVDGADVLVCQGIDAGGHQFRRGMGVASLVPAVRTMLDEDFPDKEVAILAAGGISDGRGVAAALALGAEGVVMGTRFTVADESIYPEHRKQAVLAASDGGTETFKSPFNDQINNNKLWGPLYDGRSIVGPVHEKFMKGASLEECQKSLKDDYSTEEATKIINTWAGTGVGLVRKAMPAAQIVREIRDEATATIQNLADRFLPKTS